MALNRKQILLLRSDNISNGKPEAPSATALNYGEIALNYAANNETLFLKNNSDTIVSLNINNINSHISNVNNPHKVNGEQVTLKGFVKPTSSFSLSGITSATTTSHAVEVLYSNIFDLQGTTNLLQTNTGSLSTKISTVSGTANTNKTNISSLSGKVSTNTSNIENLQDLTTSINTTLTGHTTNFSNPHKVNGSQVKLVGFTTPIQSTMLTAISADTSVTDAIEILYSNISDNNIHASSTGNVHSTTAAQIKLNGYSKPTAYSAIVTGDTINAALGKLEVGLNNVSGLTSTNKNNITTLSGQVSTNTTALDSLSSNVSSISSKLNTHISNVSNPHKVNGSQVTLNGFVKPETSILLNTITSATTTSHAVEVLYANIFDLQGHVTNYNNPHKVNGSQVKLDGFTRPSRVSYPLTNITSSSTISDAVEILYTNVENNAKHLTETGNVHSVNTSQINLSGYSSASYSALSNGISISTALGRLNGGVTDLRSRTTTLENDVNNLETNYYTTSSTSSSITLSSTYIDYDVINYYVNSSSISTLTLTFDSTFVTDFYNKTSTNGKSVNIRFNLWMTGTNPTLVLKVGSCTFDNLRNGQKNGVTNGINIVTNIGSGCSITNTGSFLIIDITSSRYSSTGVISFIGHQ